MRSALRWIAIFGFCLVVLAVQATTGRSAETTQRFALVIGNASYAAGRLPTAAADAGLVAQTLAQSGFDVTAMADTDAAMFRKTLSFFADKVRAAGGQSTVFVYLSGYGLQFAGDNYLVPIDAQIDRQAEVPLQAVPLGELQKTVESLPAKARFLVYDLAHENHFAKAEATPLAGGLTTARPASGSLIAFNAAPGMNGRADLPPYGLYARALTEALRTPGLPPQALFTRVRLRVAEITGGAVVPWHESKLAVDLPIDSGAAVEDKPSPTAGTPRDVTYWNTVAQDTLEAYRTFLKMRPDDGLAPRVRTMVAMRLEEATWSASVAVDTPAAYWTYMLRLPRGPHYVDVRRRLAGLHASLQPAPRFDLYKFDGLPAPTLEQTRMLEQPALPVEDPDGLTSPPVPNELLPPPLAAIFVDLAPPPLVPRGVLPVPAPFLVGQTRASLDVPGRITQPFVPGLGTVIVQSGLLGTVAAMSISSEDGLVARTVTAHDKASDEITITETDVADEVISRTRVTRGDGDSVVRILQSGPDGAPLLAIVTRIEPLGQRVTTISYGKDGRIAEVRSDRRGVIADVTRGAASPDDGTFDVPGTEGLRGVPRAARPQSPLVGATSAAAKPAPKAALTLPPMPPSDLASPAAPPATTTPAKAEPSSGPKPLDPPAGSPAPVKPSTRAPATQAREIVPLPVPRPPTAPGKARKAGARDRAHP